MANDYEAQYQAQQAARQQEQQQLLNDGWAWEHEMRARQAREQQEREEHEARNLEPHSPRRRGLGRLGWFILLVIGFALWRGGTSQPGAASSRVSDPVSQPEATATDLVRKADNRELPEEKATPASTPAVSSVSVIGTWQGQFDGSNAWLLLEHQSGDEFTGNLVIQAGEGRYGVTIVGKLRENNRISLEETGAFLEPAGQHWTLGRDEGTLDVENQSIAGSGKDSDPAHSSYTWSFHRTDSDTSQDSVPETVSSPPSSPSPSSAPLPETADWNQYEPGEMVPVAMSGPKEWTPNARNEGTDASLRLVKAGNESVQFVVRTYPQTTESPYALFQKTDAEKSELENLAYHRNFLRDDAKFRDNPAASWTYTEVRKGTSVRVTEFGFQRFGRNWEVSLIAPVAEYDTYVPTFDRLCDSLHFVDDTAETSGHSE